MHLCEDDRVIHEALGCPEEKHGDSVLINAEA
jgi:hypothetical protein